MNKQRAMSRSEKQLGNPASQFWRWSSEQKCFVYWDKDKGEDGELVHVPENTPFIVLDQLNTVVGYDKESESGIYSNEVRNIKTQTFYVRAGKKMFAQGVWDEIKKYSGPKFAKSVYALAKIDGEYKTVNIKMSGSACSEWFDFVKASGGERKLYEDVVIACVGADGPHKNGATVYFKPKFKVVSRKLSEDTGKLALDADKELQEYLKAHLDKPDLQEDVVEPASDEDTFTTPPNDEPVDEEEIPF